MFTRRALLCFLVLGAAVLASAWMTTEPALAGKPNPPPPPPPLPPVRYQIQFFGMPNDSGGIYFNHMNNYRQVVGWNLNAAGERRGFLYDPQTNPQAAVDLNSIGVVGIPAGWAIASAVDINDSGVIVGYIEPLGSFDAVKKGYVLNLYSTPTLTQLPDLWGDNALGRQINNDGDILGTYYRADNTWRAYIYKAPYDVPPQDLGLSIAGTDAMFLSDRIGSGSAEVVGVLAGGVAFRFAVDRSQPMETFPTVAYVLGANSQGTFCGGSHVIDKNHTQHLVPVRVADQPRIFTNLSGQANSINASGDMLVSQGLYRDDYGLIDVNALVVGTAADVALWKSGSANPIKLNDRQPINFGDITGKIQFSDGSQRLFPADARSAPVTWM